MKPHYEQQDNSRHYGGTIALTSTPGLLRPGAARLETRDGVPIPNAWNIQHLRKFYP